MEKEMLENLGRDGENHESGRNRLMSNPLREEEDLMK
jgi:hypothetical protein